MFVKRILVVLTPPLDAAGAASVICSALEAAARPIVLRFALPDSLQTLRVSQELPPTAELLFYPDVYGVGSVLTLLTDETHFLLLSGAHGFAPKWDTALCAALRGVPERRAALTGSIRPPQGSLVAETPATTGANLRALRDALHVGRLNRVSAVTGDTKEFPSARRLANAPAVYVPPQACLPALDENFDEDGVLIARGLPLVCCAAPVRTLVIDPALVFASVDFLREVSADLATLSIAAYVAGYAVYALPDAFLWPLKEPSPRRLRRPVSDALPGTTLARFEQLAGFRYDQRRAGVRTRWGLFNVEDTYAQRLPLSLAVSHRARSARMYLSERYMPLLVSAFIDLPNPSRPAAAYLLRFGFLRAIRSLPLLLYTGGSQERLLRSSFPNTQSYPDHSVLPDALLSQGLSAEAHFTRSKPALMLRAASQRSEFTHVAWVDMNILPHPICPDAVPDFTPLMDDRVHIATVNGIPDLSCIVAPNKLLRTLAREAANITSLDVELKRDQSEAALWQRMFRRRPELFAIHPMPRRKLLFLTAFDLPLLSARLNANLRDLPAPYLGVAADGARAANQRKGDASHD